MDFHVVTTMAEVRQLNGPAVYLIREDWNDWFKFRTLYALVVVDAAGKLIRVGSTKIGQRGMKDGTESPALEPSFEELSEEFFSVGQSEDFYESINQLLDLREHIYKGLRDCAFDLTIFDEVQSEYVMGESLLRSVGAYQVTGRLHRLAHGKAELTHYSFVYALPMVANVETAELKFEVNPRSSPPTNVHVLIGRNGVGKTRCLGGMTNALMARKPVPGGHEPGTFHQDEEEGAVSFANLICVSFSAFDSSTPLPRQTSHNGMLYSYVGLKRQPEAESKSLANQVTSPQSNMAPPTDYPKTVDQLADEFATSMESLQTGLHKSRWQKALKTLESDPLFAEFEVSGLVDNDQTGNWKPDVIKFFKNLSSGHAIVLLTITRLVELVEERSLVLIDEPEGHLHPPLLSAFVRVLSDLLIQRNGVAIVATHSPVVLQEVPKSCVWVLGRSGKASRADRPQIETFGENVGVLTREVFGLEVTRSGFYALIEQQIDRAEGDYDEVLQHFANQMGAEGRAIVRGLCAAMPSTNSGNASMEDGE
jgi:hypothetical protein